MNYSYDFFLKTSYPNKLQSRISRGFDNRLGCRYHCRTPLDEGYPFQIMSGRLWSEKAGKINIYILSDENGILNGI